MRKAREVKKQMKLDGIRVTKPQRRQENSGKLYRKFIILVPFTSSRMVYYPKHGADTLVSSFILGAAMHNSSLCRRYK